MTADDSTPRKKCAKCKQLVPLADYNKNRSKPDGLGTECRPCANAHSKKYHAENRDAHLARGRANYAAKSADYKQRARAWERANPEKKKQMRAAQRAKDVEKIKEHSRRDWQKHGAARRAKKAEWRSANADKCSEYVRARQARLTKQMPSWANRAAILEVYRLAKTLTKLTGIKHHVDHIYPLKGEFVSGLHVEGNLQAIPAQENQRKNNRMPKEAV